MKKIKTFILVVLVFGFAFTMGQKVIHPNVNVCSGKIERLENFSSKYVSERSVDIWLPEGYSKDKKYAVIYMHDGQMLYDSTITWNKQEWMVDEVLTELMKKGEIKNCIVVGVYNSDKGRHSDYYPQKAYDIIPEDGIEMLKKIYPQNNGKEPFPNGNESDDYLKFLTSELKPYIDKNYSTLPDKANTYVAGSSMGGLISMYAVCEYPEVFGGAACISTHWIGFSHFENTPIPKTFADYLDKHLPKSGDNKIYFDYGTETIDQYYEPGQKLVDDVMRKHNYNSTNWMTKKFPGENHSERSWQKRLHIPMLFLLGTK